MPNSKGQAAHAARAGAPTTVSAWAIAALSFAAFASSASIRICDALLPRLDADFGVGLGVAAQVVTAFAIAYGAFQAFYGPLGDHFGKYRVVAWACGASVFTALGCALAPGFGALVVARFFAGATAAAVIPLSMAWIGDAVPYEHRQPVLARFLTGQIIGFATGPLAGGFAADHLDWRAPFVALAIWFALACAMLMRVERGRQRVAVAEVNESPEVVARSLFAGFAYVLRQRWSRVVLVTVFLEGAALFGPFAFLATHLHRAVGLSLSAAGATLMLYGAGGLTFAGLSRFLVRRLGEARLAAAGGGVLCVAFLMLGLGTSWALAMLGAFFAGLGFYMIHNTLQTNATQMAPERRGASVALFASCLFVGQSVGVAGASIVVERIGTMPIIVGGGFALLAIAGTFGWRVATRKH
jgi:predicted MFS family arabinose efflux permease